MSNERNTGDEPPEERPSKGGDDALAALMTLAGSRTRIPEDAERRIRKSVQAEWRQATAVRRTVRWAAPLALAASVVVALTIGLRTPEVVSRPIGTVARVSDAAIGFAAGDEVAIGDTIATTASGGLSFSLRDDTSVRIARDSVLVIDGKAEFTLLAGAVYLDTGESIYPDRQIVLNSEFGTVTDVGTQFAVTLSQSAMRVAVREGRVDIATGARTLAALAGNSVTVAEGVSPVSDAISPVDEAWDWAEALAPRFDLEGRSVLDFLKWVSRETGMELEFASDADRQAAMSATLYGSIDDLTPMEALVSVMPTTAFDYVIDGDAISVRR